MHIHVFKITIMSHTLMQVSTPKIRTGQASSRTVPCRSSELRCQRKRISDGDECAQLASEVTASSQERRRALIEMLREKGGIKISIPPGEALAMKVDLHLAYQKTRDMRRQV